MQNSMVKNAALTVFALAGAVALSGCVQMHLSEDFGSAVRQDVAAQIADPDAHYVGSPAPGAADGPRVALAQDHYEKNKVIQPIGTSSNIGASVTPNMPQ